MTLDRAVFAFAGLVVLAGVILSLTAHPLWIWLSAFAGANMLQASFTGFCPAGRVFKKRGVNPGTAFLNPPPPGARPAIEFAENAD